MSLFRIKPAASIWQRLLIKLKAWDEAIHFDYDDRQDKRIEALERRVVDLEARVDRRATSAQP